MSILLVSRPTLEAYVRARVAALPQVTILAGTEATGLIEDGGRIAGVRATGPDGPTTLDTRLVVDATGRSNRGPAWLAELGYPEVDEDVVRANLSTSAASTAAYQAHRTHRDHPLALPGQPFAAAPSPPTATGGWSRCSA